MYSVCLATLKNRFQKEDTSVDTLPNLPELEGGRGERVSGTDLFVENHVEYTFRWKMAIQKTHRLQLIVLSPGLQRRAIHGGLE